MLSQRLREPDLHPYTIALLSPTVYIHCNNIYNVHCHYNVSDTWYLAMLMVRSMCGIGRQQSYTASSKHTMMCVQLCCGTRMKPAK